MNQTEARMYFLLTWMFKIGSRVQAIDPLLGTWLNASITALNEQEGKVEVKWNEYTKNHNWIKSDDIRWPEDERPLNKTPHTAIKLDS